MEAMIKNFLGYKSSHLQFIKKSSFQWRESQPPLSGETEQNANQVSIQSQSYIA